jgi:transposase-like protein
MRDWANESPPVQPREVEEGDLLLLDESVPLTPKQLWRLVYDLNFIQQFHSLRRNREVGIGCWQKTGEREFTKSAHYITPVKKNVIGPSEAYTEEEYRCERRGESGFAVTVCAYNRKVPYGGSFHVELFWTAARVSPTHTRLQVVGRFVPEKRMLGVAGIIKKATNEGLKETYDAFREHLWSTIRSGGVTRHASKPAAIRSMSTAAKEAAEELINNGIFVSWGQLLTAALLILCACMLARLAADHEARAMILRKWRQEWEPQLLGFQHEKLSTGTAVVVHDPGFV